MNLLCNRDDVADTYLLSLLFLNLILPVPVSPISAAGCRKVLLLERHYQRVFRVMTLGVFFFFCFSSFFNSLVTRGRGRYERKYLYTPG